MTARRKPAAKPRGTRTAPEPRRSAPETSKTAQPRGITPRTEVAIEIMTIVVVLLVLWRYAHSLLAAAYWVGQLLS